MTDWNAAANASIARARQGQHPATCKRCGATGLAWAQNKAGKWYLCEATIGTAGSAIPSKHRPHFKNCTAQKG